MSPADGFSLVYAAAAVCILAVLAIVWPRRHAPAGTELSLVLMAAAFWAACDAIELQVPTMEGKRLVAQFQYIGIVSAPPLFLLAARALAGYGGRLSPALLTAVWTVPVASLVFAWTNRWHHWLWTDVVPPSADSPFTVYRYG